MSPEQEFETEVLRRIYLAREVTGYSFAGLLKLIGDVGAVEATRRLIAPSNIGRFQRGMRTLSKAGMLSCSVEQVVVDFGRAGKVFNQSDIQAAADRLQIMRMILVKGRR